jgi:hypothetical protein
VKVRLDAVPTGLPKDAAKEHSVSVEVKVRLDAVPTGLPKDAVRQTV